MNMAQAIGSCFKKYATFSGRARRSEYWFWTLFQVLISLVWFVVLIAVAVAIGASDPDYFESGTASSEYDAVFGVVGLLIIVTVLVFLLPSLAVQCRRLHDTGRSGWWTLLGIVPFGFIIVIVWLCEDSVPGPNQYGPSPKALHPGYGYGPAPYGSYGPPQYGPQYGSPQYGPAPYGPYGQQPPPPPAPPAPPSGYGQPGSPSYGRYGQPDVDGSAPAHGTPPPYGTPAPGAGDPADQDRPEPGAPPLPR